MSFESHLQSFTAEIDDIKSIKLSGKVISVRGVIIECIGITEFVSIGTQLKIYNKVKGTHIFSEVVGFNNEITLAMPFGETEGVSRDSQVEVCQDENIIFPSEQWLGRVLNAHGKPIDEKGAVSNGTLGYPLKASPPPSQQRQRIGEKIDLGVKSIDAFASCCYGQRLGIFAGSGVGKSVLISMLTKYANTDIKVIGLIGERSREAKEFIEEYLGAEGLKSSIVIMSTGDESPLLRKRAAYMTIAISEYFRDQGKEVLCIMDSVTRFAMAQREIGLAIGEPPTSKSYTPSVFSELPKLLERAGPGISGSNITGLFTVLVEGDDQNEPISDAVRGILDGHIVLDRSIAERGRFPAVDVLKSVSRALPRCNSELENRQITYAKKMLAIYTDMAEMIRLGAYRRGTDKQIDLAIELFDKIEEFLIQKPDEYMSMEETFKKLGEIIKINE